MAVRLHLLVDRAIIRDGIRALFDATPEFLIVGEGLCLRPGSEDLDIPSNPDVVLVDEQLRERDGLATAAALIERYGLDALGVIVLADAPHAVNIARAARIGVRGYLLEDDETWLLMAGIKAVASGEAWWSPRATRYLLDEYRRSLLPPPHEADRALPDLTERERTVVRLVALGRSNAEIAHELVLGRATVKSHISRILTKLELRDRTQVAAYAYRNGLVNTE